MTVKTYKLIKAVTQLVTIGAGMYAMSLGADPMTTFILMAAIVTGPEGLELLYTNATPSDNDN